MHPQFINPTTRGRHRRCPCGALTEPGRGLCRKCHARILWRRRHSRGTQRAARRLASRQARHSARLFANAISLLGLISQRGGT
jgi:hypothetical protein